MQTHDIPTQEAISDRALEGRIAVITGASSGIGAAAAHRLAPAGVQVALIGRRTEWLTALAHEIGAGQALAVPANVTSPHDLGRAAGVIADQFGHVDVVVANAGVMLPAPLQELRIDEWRRMIELNLVGVVETVRVFLPALLEAATRREVADLILISSLSARAIFPGYAVYGATKAAVWYLASAWRTELAPQGVRVTAVEPGLTHSELADPARASGVNGSSRHPPGSSAVRRSARSRSASSARPNSSIELERSRLRCSSSPTTRYSRTCIEV
jgi:NADP-dependent 3-hydroxy acid dehydrogenase YdfG